MKLQMTAILGLIAFTSVSEAKWPKEAEPFARAFLEPRSGSRSRGTIDFAKLPNGLMVKAYVDNVPPGTHGLHIHEAGDCSASDASSAGDHFDPMKRPHGGPEETQRHIGDFGNVEASEEGSVRFQLKLTDVVARRFDWDGVIGRSVILHADADDLTSQPSGSSGGRIACGIIRSLQGSGEKQTNASPLHSPHGGVLRKADLESEYSHWLVDGNELYFELVLRGKKWVLYPFEKSPAGLRLVAISPRNTLNEFRATVIGLERKQELDTIVSMGEEAIEVWLNPLSEKLVGIEEGDPLLLKIVTIHNRKPKTAQFRTDKEEIIGLERAPPTVISELRPKGPVPDPIATVSRTERRQYAESAREAMATWRKRIVELKRRERSDVPRDERRNLYRTRRYLEGQLENVERNFARLRDSRNITWTATRQMLESQFKAMENRYKSVLAE